MAHVWSGGSCSPYPGQVLVVTATRETLLDSEDEYVGSAASLPLTVTAAGHSASLGLSFPHSDREGPGEFRPLRLSSDDLSRVSEWCLARRDRCKR